jgi:tetratricopeptide (TPR) repeat protein
MSLFTEAREQEVLQKLIEEKLLVSGRKEGGEPTVDVAHEALFSSWPRLQKWIEDGKQVLFVHNRLADDAARWEDRRQKSDDQADEELLGGTRLAQAIEMRDRKDFALIGGLSPTETEFLVASSAQRDRLRERERRQTRRIIASISIGGAVALVFGIVSLFLYRSANLARKAATLAQQDAERATIIVSDEHEQTAELTSKLILSLREKKVQEEVLQGSVESIFSERKTEADDKGTDTAELHRRSVALDAKGAILQKAGLPGALDVYSAALKLRERAAKNTQSATALHDLAVSHDNLGDWHVAEAGAAAEQSPEEAKAYDLARKEFELSLTLSEKLAKGDPESVRWQNDLAVSCVKIGGVYFNQRPYEKAKDMYEKGFKIADSLVKRDKAFPKWKALRAFFISALGRTNYRLGDFKAAEEKLNEAHAIFAELARANLLTPEQEVDWSGENDADLKELKDRLAQKGRSPDKTK